MLFHVLEHVAPGEGTRSLLASLRIGLRPREWHLRDADGRPAGHSPGSRQVEAASQKLLSGRFEANAAL